MNDWAVDGGPFAAAIATFIVVGLAWIVGWWLYTLLAPPRPPTTPNELGRSWAGVALFFSSTGQLPQFFVTFDIFPLVMWFLGASTIATSAFALGWGYGKWFKFSNQTTPLPNATPGNEPLVADKSITISDRATDAELAWLFGEQLALYEAFIGKHGLSYYLNKFDDFVQQEPKPTPVFTVFPAYKHTAKFFKPSWNWSAFFFAYGWALYRKLYGWSIALFLTSVFCFMAIKEGAVGLGFSSLIAAYVAFGMYANALYYSKAKRVIVAAGRTNRSKTQVRLDVSDKGGINPWARWVAAGQVLVGIPAILMVLLVAPVQQVSITSNSPSQVSLPNSSEVMDAPEMADVPQAAPVEPKQETPDVYDPYKNMQALYRDQRYRNLAAVVQDHLLENPNDATALNYGGLALKGLGDIAGARENYTRAIAINPTDPSLYYNLAITYDMATEYQLVIKLFGVAHKLDPNNKLVNDALSATQQHAQRKDTERRAQTEYRNSSRSDGIDNDEPECKVKPVMTDAEIRHWRICSQQLR